MNNFNSSYKRLLTALERKYDIELTLGEKVSLKHCLKYSQTIIFSRTLEEKVGVSQLIESEIMWLRQYEISLQDYKTFGDMEEFTQHFKKIREDCLLL